MATLIGINSEVRPQRRSTCWKWSLAGVTASFLPILVKTIQVAIRDGFQPYYLKFNVLIAGLALVLAGLFLLTAFEKRRLPRKLTDGITTFLERFRWLDGMLMIVAGLACINVLFVRHFFLQAFSAFWSGLFFASLAIFVEGWLLHFLLRQDIVRCFVIAGIALGVVGQIIVFLPLPLNYPFSLTWSEASWSYYASFFFSKRIYGTTMPWPFLDIGQPLLLSPSFLYPGAPIWLTRLWHYGLSLGMALLLAWTLRRRLKNTGWPAVWLMAWIFLWVLIGPVYSHLCLAAALIIGTYDRTRPGKSIFYIVMASIWTGILRINWLPMPAILAIGLYLLETPFKNKKGILRYLLPPVYYGVSGLLAGGAAMLGYLALSGRADTRLGTKFSAPFLLYRLWPNATLQTGILLGAALVSLGLWIAILLSWRKHRYHALRLGLLLALLLLLFAGGTLASTRIGGGNNLHNLDAYLVFLAVWGSYALFDRIEPEARPSTFTPSWGLITLIFLTPVFWILLHSPYLASRNLQQAQVELSRLQARVQPVSGEGQPVLFIYQRHLLTYGYIRNVPLVTDYELEELSEMVNSNNREYLNRFYADLKSHRFGLIILDNSTDSILGLDHSFAAENNAWVERVILPLEEEYGIVLTLPQSGVVVYAPLNP